MSIIQDIESTSIESAIASVEATSMAISMIVTMDSRASFNEIQNIVEWIGDNNLTLMEVDGQLILVFSDNSAFSKQFIVSGRPPHTFTYTGELPTGLSLSSGGLLSGSVSLSSTSNPTFDIDIYTEFLSHYDTNFSDVYGNVVTVHGTTPTIDTNTKVFGAGSIHFPGGDSGLYVAPTNNGWQLSGGPWTIDFWVNTTSIPVDGCCMASVVNSTQSWSSTTGHAYLMWFGLNGLYFQTNNGSNGNTDYNGNEAVAMTAGVWYHMAATYDGTTLRFFRDGTLGVSVAATFPVLAGYDNAGINMFLGKYPWAPSNAGAFTGYVDEYRFSRTCRWTSSFTRPSAPYTS